MRIKVSEQITGECPPNCGFPLQRVWQVIEKHDQVHEIHMDELVIRLLSRHSSYYGVDLVGLETKPQELAIFAFRIYPDLCEEAISDMAPLDLLRRFVDRFGLIVRVGNRENKFHLQQVIPIENPQSGTQLLSVANPENHTHIVQSFIKASRDGRSVEAAIAFCIDTTAYAAWRKMHE